MGSVWCRGLVLSPGFTVERLSVGQTQKSSFVEPGGSFQMAWDLLPFVPPQARRETGSGDCAAAALGLFFCAQAERDAAKETENEGEPETDNESSRA